MEQSINWHLTQYEKTREIYYLAKALAHFKTNMPLRYQQLTKQITKQIGKPEPIRIK